MAKYRENSPLLSNEVFLTDGGLETSLIFHQGYELPYFAAFDLLKDQQGCRSLEEYYRQYIRIAVEYKLGFILESATWRANKDWAEKLGYTKETLDKANRQSIALMAAIRKEYESEDSKILLSGCIGPRGDGYEPGDSMTVEQARAYHSEQINSFKNTEADMVCAITMTNVEEAMGITLAAQDVTMPVSISFTVETDGRLPTGQTLKQAIEEIDQATANGPMYYMINCAHPSHFEKVISSYEAWLSRIRGVRANASCKSHAELDDSEQLDEGNPQQLAQDYVLLNSTYLI